MEPRDMTPLPGRTTVVAMMADGSSFATEVLNYRLQDNQLWIRSTTWPDGRDVEGTVAGLLVGNLA